MIPKQLLLISWLVAGGLGITNLYAQTGIQAAGGNARGSKGTASYSVGQVAYLTAAGLDGTSTPGTQQPLEIFVVTSNRRERIEVECTAYPNPTTSSLTLRVDEQVARKLNWSLLDLSGRQLLSQPMTGLLTTISLAPFPAGTYMLVIRGEAQEFKSFKIIKR